MPQLFRISLLVVLTAFLAGCPVPLEKASSTPPDPPLTYTPAETSSSIFNVDFNPSNTLESPTLQLERPLSTVEMMDSKSRSEYDGLKSQQAAVENRINELDNMRRGADIDIIKVLSSGGANMGNKHLIGSGDLQSVYEDPHIFIQNKQWEREFAVNEIVEKQRELRRINQKIDDLLNESKKGCFPAKTTVLMGDGGFRPIAEITVGDRVMVYDIGRDELAAAPVIELFESDNNHYYRVNDSVAATAYERFLTRQGWRKVRDLTVMDEIYDGNDFTRVERLEKTSAELTVYNLRVDSAHNFFVSTDGNSFLLVHNSGGGGGDGGGGGGGGK